MSFRGILFFLFAALCAVGCSNGNKAHEIVEIKTSYGDIYLWLYDETPLHKDNFLKLANEGFYDNTQFHRIINGFMIQGGDPLTKDPSAKQNWGTGSPGYTIKPEFNSKFYHRKGTLAAARMPDQINPGRESSGSQFYIVQGRKFSDNELDVIEKEIQLGTGNLNFSISAQARKDYKEIGGAPHLDMQYTIFGEVIQGIDVVDKIATAETGSLDRPLESIKMDINIVSVTAKDLKIKYKFQAPI